MRKRERERDTEIEKVINRERERVTEIEKVINR